MRLSWPWWIIPPRLGVVLGGGASLGAFEVGCIDVMARRGIVPKLVVGTSVGAINAAFWARDPAPDIGARLLDLWLHCDRSVMFPDGPVPMVGRLVQGRGHLTTQAGLERMLRRTLDSTAKIEDTAVPLAVIATDATTGRRTVMRSGPLLPALQASAAIPGLWPPVAIDGSEFYDGGLVSNCDVQAAVDERMTDLVVIDVMSDSDRGGASDFWQVVERALSFMAARQLELALEAFGRGVRIAVLRPRFTRRPGFADFSQTRRLFEAGQVEMAAFLDRRLGPRLSVRPGVDETVSGLRAGSPADSNAPGPGAPRPVAAQT